MDTERAYYGLRTFEFQYDPAWIENPNAIPLSVSLPLQKESFGGIAYNFFDNILPESQARDYISRILKVFPENIYALLRELGGDCAGALKFYPEAVAPDPTKGFYQPLSSMELADVVERLQSFPFLVRSEGVRLTLAGAQDKLPVHFDGTTISLPRNDAPSTHILKPPWIRFESVVINEMFCMTLAKNAGLPVPDCRIVHAGYMPLFLVDRYDRKYVDGRIVRIHQEDFCQAMGLCADEKYQEHGGPGFADCANFLRKQSAFPEKDIELLAKWCVANVLLGNADGHAKNLSLLYDQGSTPRLAPFYDIISTLAYDRICPKFSMKIGKKNRIKWIIKQHWERFANDLGLEPIKFFQDMSEFCQTMKEAITPTLESMEPKGEDVDFLEKLESDTRKRIERTLQKIK